MEVAFVQQPLFQALGMIGSAHRKACRHFLPQPTTLPLSPRPRRQHARLSSRINVPAWWSAIHAKSNSVQLELHRRRLRGRSTQKGASCQAPGAASCRASAGGATLVQEESPAVRATDIDKLIKRLRELRKRLRAASSIDERRLVLESDPEVQRVWKALRDVRHPLRLDEAHGKYLLDCMIAAGQGHLLESLKLLAPKERVNGNRSNGALHSNGALKEVDTGVSLLEAHSDRAPYLDAFHMLADAVRKLESDGESDAPNHPALLTPLLAPEHLAPANAHAWEQRLASGRSESGVDAVKTLVDMLARLEKFYDSIGGVVGYQLAALELIRSSEEREKSAEEMESALGGNSEVPLPESPMWDGSELLEDEGAETNYHMPVGPDLAADPDFAQRAAAWGLAVSFQRACLFI